MIPAHLLYADTERSAALRHEVPASIGDPLLWAEIDGQAYVTASPLEESVLAEAAPQATRLTFRELGFYELLQEGGRTRDEILVAMNVAACRRIGLTEALVPFDFPTGMADALRAEGVALTVDDEAFARRRRVRSEVELSGVRRAQRAAEAGMAAAAAILRSADITDDGWLSVDGRPLTAEDVRAALREACQLAGAPAPPDVIVASVHQGFGHEPGSGPLPAHLPIQVDLWPRDEATACWADMTRTFVVGEVDARTREQEAMVRAALDDVIAACRPGVLGRDLLALVLDRFEAAGHRSQRTGPDPEHPTDGMQFSLGHGIGLELHAAPGMGMLGHEPFVAGEVVAVEPGLWDHRFGGVRFEDLLLVTEDGCEVLTDFPYDLAP